MFDSHCHLHDAQMDAVRDAAIARARAAGVHGFLLAGVDADGWQVQDALRRRHPDVAVAYGLHPQRIPELTDAEVDAQIATLARALRSEAETLQRPHALGEIGLDRRTEETAACLPRQEHAFRAQLALAREHDVPVVLHILRAHGEAVRVLRRDGLPRAGGVVHSYSGSADLVADYVGLGLHVSFAGALTYPNSRRIKQAARAVPPERLLIETDAPFQTPLQHRPGPCEPAFLTDVLAALADVRVQSPAELARLTDENARRLFGFPHAK